MAIYGAVPPPSEGIPSNSHPSHPSHQHQPSSASTASIDIEAWTVSALESLSVSPIARGTGTPLSIPLDAAHGRPPAPAAADEGTPSRLKLTRVSIAVDDGLADITPPRRPPSRRDSQVRREAFLKGKEGSRRRRQWENSHLVGVPNAEPPLPSDWEVHPTYPVHHVPYQLAAYWDKGVRELAEERRAAFAAQRKQKSHIPAGARARAEVGMVPKELRVTAKKTPAVKSWLRVLEEPVRQFLVDRGAVAEPKEGADGGSSDATTDSEDDEIVFVGRGGSSMRDGKDLKKARLQAPDRPAERGMVLDSLDDESGAFKRWLTHSISDYYGLESRSVMMGNPSRRVVYIGIRQTQRGDIPIRPELPRPLWELC